MFASKKPPSIRSLVGEGTVIQGTLQFSDGLRVDGEVQGDIVSTSGSAASILVISEKAKVIGSVRAAHVIINGTVIGPVECTSLLELQANARIQGDVHYQALEMQQGATIEGSMHRVAGSPAATPALEHDKSGLKLLANQK